MLKEELSGLWTHIVTEKRFIVRADELLTAFVELQRDDPRTNFGAATDLESIELLFTNRSNC